MVTSNHNVAPWLFPKYYPESFMPMINENHTHYTLELRSTTGEVFTSIDLLPRVVHHPDRDIAVLHIEQEIESMEFLKQLNFILLDTEEYLPADDEVRQREKVRESERDLLVDLLFYVVIGIRFSRS